MSIRGLQQGDNLDDILRRSIRSRQKRKAQDLFGGVLVVTGFPMFVFGGGINTEFGCIGITVAAIGAFLMGWSRAMTWWERGEFYDER
jgi:hypothetical protein